MFQHFFHKGSRLFSVDLYISKYTELKIIQMQIVSCKAIYDL